MSILENITGLQRLAATGDATAQQQLAAIGLWTSDELRDQRGDTGNQIDEYSPSAESLALDALEDSILIGEGNSFDPDTGEMLDAEFLPRGLDAFRQQSEFQHCFVIRHQTDVDEETGEPLYWVNNSEGFTGWSTLRSLSEKDFYSAEDAERYGHNLAISGVWESCEIARKRIVQCGSCEEVFLKGELPESHCMNCFADEIVSGFIEDNTN